MSELDLPELEREFRHTWTEYNPSRYANFLDRASDAHRLELLTRMLSAELEYFYQPPTVVLRPLPAGNLETRDAQGEDDQRVRPCVQLFALRFAELSKNPEFILRLVVLEYALRLRHDAIPPNVDSYLDFCPFDTQERLISLLELTECKLSKAAAQIENLARKDDSTVKESDASASIKLEPLPYNLGCFLLIRLIGRGGMGYVHAAIDLRSAAQVAVKVMRRVDAWSIFRYVEEFSWLSELNHPHLVRLYDAFSDGDVRYFSMELVEGRTIREWFRRQSSKREAKWTRLRLILSQLASAVHFLHNRGVVHRDIKCSNVMIASSRRAVLLDLGLAVRANENEASSSHESDRLVGTLQYMAPEGLSGQPLGYASDWYSFGVMLYEVLTDEYPPIQVDLEPTTHAKKYVVDELLLQARLNHCPPDIAQLCVELLNPEPARRPEGDDILRRLGGRTVQNFEVRSADQLLGREDCLQRLSASLKRLTASPHSSSLVVVRGELGNGKSALVQCWMNELLDQHVFVFSARCFRQDHTPLRLLNQLVQVLVRSLSNQSESLWRTPVDEFARKIARTFPQIQQLVSAKSKLPLKPPGRDYSEANLRRDVSQQALASLLRSISQKLPIIIVVDDAQWSDSESMGMLLQMLCEPTFNGMLVLTETSDGPSLVGNYHALQSLEPTGASLDVIELAPLTDEVCGQLLRKWSTESGQQLEASVQRVLAHRSGGNPFLLQELFRAYLDMVLRGELPDQRWLASDPQENTLQRFIRLPIQAENPSNAEIVLQYLAVADQPLGFHQLQMVSRIVPHELQHTLSYLTSEGWVRSSNVQLDTDVEISHENFRQLVVESMPADKLQRRHYRMARILSGETSPPWPRIAYHYWTAEMFREAAACYMEAARVAANSSALGDALFFLERAMHPAADRNSLEQLSAYELKATCLAGIGNSAAAADAFEELRAQTTDSKQAVVLDCLAGEQWVRAGQLGMGLQLLSRALTEIGVAPRSKSWLSAWFLRLWAWQATQREIPARDYEVDTVKLPAFSPLEQSLNRIIAPLTFLDHHFGAELTFKLDKRAADHGSDFDRALTGARLAVVLGSGNRYTKIQAVQRLRASAGLAEESSGRSHEATVDFCLFVWYVQRGFRKRATRFANRALRLFAQDPKSAQWEIQFLNWGLLSCYWEAGRIRDVQKLTKQLREGAHERSDLMSLFWMNVSASILSDLAEDHLEKAKELLNVAQRAVENQSFQPPRFFVWMSAVQIATYSGDWQDAQRLLNEQWKQMEQSLLLGRHMFLWIALTTRLCVDLVSHRKDSRNRRWLRDAQRTVRRITALPEKVFSNYGKAAGLVVNAADGHVASQEDWTTSILQMRAMGYDLFATALQWHQARHAPSSDSKQRQILVEQELIAAGVVNPLRLLNVVLPG
ncbi:MAG: protein kinase [Pirellulaceae bacterium]